MSDIRPLTEAEIKCLSLLADAAKGCAFTPLAIARLLATIRALQSEKAAQAEALKTAREALDEFASSIDCFNRNGPNYTFNDGTQVLDASVIMDREDIVNEALAKIDALLAGEERK